MVEEDTSTPQDRRDIIKTFGFHFNGEWVRKVNL